MSKTSCSGSSAMPLIPAAYSFNPMPRALVVAARQPEFSSLLEAAGYDVIVQTRPVDGAFDADVAVVFRGRLIGRGQAAALAAAGVPVVEVFTATPTAR